MLARRLTATPLTRLLLLWLLVALVPLRGWAAGTMQGAHPATDLRPAIVAEASTPSADDLACPHHAGHVHHDSQHDNSHPACALCDLCHAGSAPPLPQIEAEHAASTHVLTARVPAGQPQLSGSALERPPRA
jgi:hypothetical protein